MQHWKPSVTFTKKKMQELNQFLTGDGHWFYIKEMIDLGIDIWKVDFFFQDFYFSFKNNTSFKIASGLLLSSQLKPVFSPVSKMKANFMQSNWQSFGNFT